MPSVSQVGAVADAPRSSQASPSWLRGAGLCPLGSIVMILRARRYDYNGFSRWTFDPETGAGQLKNNDPSTGRQFDQTGESWLQGLKSLAGGGITIPLKGLIRGIEGQRVEFDTSQSVPLNETLPDPKADPAAKKVIEAVIKEKPNQ